MYSTLLVISECARLALQGGVAYITHLDDAAEPAATLSWSERLEWEERPWLLLACGRTSLEHMTVPTKDNHLSSLHQYTAPHVTQSSRRLLG